MTTWVETLRARLSGQSDEANTGLVFSGGGSRASFHIGAARYLYEIVGVQPTTLTGTSAGSIVASILAQSADAGEQLRLLREFESTWLAMQSSTQMYLPHSWLEKLTSQLGDLGAMLGKSDDAAHPEPPEEETTDLDAFLHSFTDDHPQPASWSLSTIWQFMMSIPRIGRVGASLAPTLRSVASADAMCRWGPIVEQLLSPASFSREAIADSGVELRVSMVGLNSGELRYMRQDGVLVDRNDAVLVDEAFNLVLGIAASCSIPGIFRPVRIGDESYVDGGVCEYSPVRFMVDHLGVPNPYVIVAGPPGVDYGDFSNRDIISTVLRTYYIQSSENANDEVRWARRYTKSTVIRAELNVHDSMTVDPGLLAINRDYGWIRAAEEVTDATAEARKTNRDLISARVAAWQLEQDIASSEAPATKGQQARLAQLRRKVEYAIRRANAELLPPDHDGWGQGPELHVADPGEQ